MFLLGWRKHASNGRAPSRHASHGGVIRWNVSEVLADEPVGSYRLGEHSSGQGHDATVDGVAAIVYGHPARFGGGGLRGVLDEIAIYGVSLSPERITAHFDAAMRR